MAHISVPEGRGDELVEVVSKPPGASPLARRANSVSFAELEHIALHPRRKSFFERLRDYFHFTEMPTLDEAGKV